MQRITSTLVSWPCNCRVWVVKQTEDVLWVMIELWGVFKFAKEDREKRSQTQELQWLGMTWVCSNSCIQSLLWNSNSVDICKKLVSQKIISKHFFFATFAKKTTFPGCWLDRLDLSLEWKLKKTARWTRSFATSWREELLSHLRNGKRLLDERCMMAGSRLAGRSSSGFWQVQVYQTSPFLQFFVC